MSDGRASSYKVASALFQIVFVVYFIGASLSAVYFNWTYARDNGFLKWMLLGQIVPTAKAVVWPYYLVRSRHDDSKPMPRSVRNFFLANEALLKANDRPSGIAPEANIDRVEPLLREAVDSARGIQRDELNAVYTGLGDHFLDEAIGSAQLFLNAIVTRDQDTLMRAAAVNIRWQQWWNVYGQAAIQALSTQYGSERQ